MQSTKKILIIGGALKLIKQFYLTYPQITQSMTEQFKICNDLLRNKHFTLVKETVGN